MARVNGSIAPSNYIPAHLNRRCCDSLKKLVNKIQRVVLAAIRDLFEMIRRGLAWLCCKRRLNPPVLGQGVQVISAVEVPRIIVNPELGNLPPMPIAPPIAQIEEVDLDRLRGAIEWKNEPALARVASLNIEIPEFSNIRDRLVPQHFLTLLDEYPNKKNLIAALAITWGKSRDITIDPQHPYFEIFQEAFKYQNELGGGAEAADHRAYQLLPNNDKYYDNPKFRYTIYSLLGFQELVRPDHRELMRRLDNGRSDHNPAYKYATAVSKILTYPTGQHGRLDIRDKITLGIDGPWKIYQTAKVCGQVFEYFQKGFNGYCFDARISALQEFCEPLITNEDFTLKFNLSSGVDHQVMEHFRVFRNKQLVKYSIEKNINYKDFQYWVLAGALHGGYVADRNGVLFSVRDREEIHRQIIDFYGQLCTADHFANYLQETGQPIQNEGRPIDRAEWEGILDGNFEP